ncbi:MAG: transposase, partial [Anaerolineales bacterium]|nr:transposase [Anaerolineales bacterium]
MFGNRYRVETTRLRNWDYSAGGYYFVTLCTWQRRCLFGEVVDGEVRLSPAGEIVADEWQKTPAIRSNVALDAWIIMPNHLHGILVISETVETR